MKKNYGVDVDRWESNGKIERLDYDEEVEKNNGKKHWKKTLEKLRL